MLPASLQSPLSARPAPNQGLRAREPREAQHRMDTGHGKGPAWNHGSKLSASRAERVLTAQRPKQHTQGPASPLPACLCQVLHRAGCKAGFLPTGRPPSPPCLIPDGGQGTGPTPRPRSTAPSGPQSHTTPLPSAQPYFVGQKTKPPEEATSPEPLRTLSVPRSEGSPRPPTILRFCTTAASLGH